jgi:hypothetical protein
MLSAWRSHRQAWQDWQDWQRRSQTATQQQYAAASTQQQRLLQRWQPRLLPAASGMAAGAA